ncbi:MAG TPA: TVP38/TMEM64 family protein [Patescibacteria group bacterium]|nr:TVP38/TMEM64 family protein [Patescibacteria group bacterium]
MISFRPRVVTILRAVLLVLWGACLFGLYWFLHQHGIRLRHFPELIRTELLRAGSFGPLLVIGLYVASTIFLFTKGSIDIVAGLVYGPVFGSLFILIGLNIAAALAFWFGRFFGAHFVQLHEKGWLKKYDEILQEEGFMTVLFMRLFLFPFDLVSIGCGMSRMSFRQYVFGTLIGSIPSTVTLVALGGTLEHPRSWGIFILLVIFFAGLALLLRRLPWVKETLYKPEQSERP